MVSLPGVEVSFILVYLQHYGIRNGHAYADKDHLQVSIEKLHPKQVENEVEIRGPPVSKAFDKAGNPTKVE
ncbi:hypothetical protein T459_03242 [Capsicum annuum]|uniref:Uncharacterized protein n=1 Tax=Capsicum annuum TaxID=4072 RepID=A0A2G3AMB4_CAPAN|nr:hypothetical protein T459_03242 [Capsicum annuum]